MAYNLLVLGPMQHRVGDTVIRASNTKRIGEILDQMSQALTAGGLKPFRVVTPENPNETAIIELIISEIEQADLVLDLTGNRPSVAYEAGVIHALGIPHIFVTEDEETSFYFSAVRVVRGLQIQADFDPAKPGPSQGELFGRLKTYLSGADARTSMAGNILTSHFEGLPLVDLAGPAGLAASYYTNAVKRFIRAGGFAGRRCQLLFKEERRARFGGKTVTSTRSVSTTVTALIAVEPPAQLSRSFFEDDRALKAALKELGIELERATIAGDDPLDKRDFGGWFDAKGIARGATVCIEIPTIVYPLTESPRILRLRKRRNRFEGEQRQIMQEVEERALEKMLASFKRNLFYHMDMESEANKNGFYYVSLSEVPSVLQKTGVL